MKTEMKMAWTGIWLVFIITMSGTLLRCGTERRLCIIETYGAEGAANCIKALEQKEERR